MKQCLAGKDPSKRHKPQNLIENIRENIQFARLPTRTTFSPKIDIKFESHVKLIIPA